MFWWPTRRQGRPAANLWYKNAKFLYSALGFASLFVVCSTAHVAAAGTAFRLYGKRALQWHFSWDGAGIVSQGGKAAGKSYDNLFKAGVSAEGSMLGLSQAWDFRATFACTQNSRSISAYAGDIQGVINLDAGSRCRPVRISARRALGRHLNARLGLIPADHYFDVAESSGLLLNSSFGVEPTWSHNTIAPIYPTEGTGAMLTWHGGSALNRVGVFQGNPQELDTTFREGEVVIDEFAWHALKGVTATYKLGIWDYRSQNSGQSHLPHSNWGLYLITEQPLSGDSSNASAFFRLGLSPNAQSAIPLDVQAGLLIPDPLPNRLHDRLSFGVALAKLRGGHTETALEATYSMAISKHIWLQPDLQFVLDPGGNGPPATVLALRAHVQFG